MPIERPPALVLGGGVTALGVTRALGARGLRVFVAAPDGDLARRCRWAHQVPGATATPPPGGLAPWLAALPLERAVLLPCTDALVLEAARLPAELRARFPASLPEPAVIEQLVDKAAFATLLRALGVPAPETWVLTGEADLDALPDDALAGSFLKPCDSQAFFRRFGVKAFRVADRAEAVARWREAAAAGLAMLLQRYVPGGPDAHWFLDGHAAAGGRVTGLLVRRRLRMYPPDFGNSSLMVTTPPGAAAPAVASLRRLLTGIAYSGMFSAEFKRDSDGTFRLLEVNARAWWYVGFAARAGVDAPWLAWQDALGHDPGTVEAYEAGRHCVYPYYDWHAPGRPGLPAWLRLLATADQPVWQASDPMPWAATVGAQVGAAIRRRLAPGNR